MNEIFLRTISVSLAIILMIESQLLAEPVADSEPVTCIGLSGCHRQDVAAPALWRYVERKPDLMIWMGDNVYTDTKSDLQVIKDGHAMLASLPAFQLLQESTRFAVTWDDHDYGLNNAGRDYVLREPSKQFFRRFWRAEKYIPADRSGVFHARYFGAGDQLLQVLLLDGRYNRGPEGEHSDTLGEEQWRWLEEELKKPAALRLIVNGYQFLLDDDTKFESWAKFPRAQARLFRLIRETKAEKVVFLAGDQHYGEVSRQRNALGYDAIELMFCGINQEEPHVLNRSRVSPVAHAKNAYALIDIQWSSSDSDEPHLLFQVFDADRDAAELTYRVNFSELSRSE